MEHWTSHEDGALSSEVDDIASMYFWTTIKPQSFDDWSIVFEVVYKPRTNVY